MRVGILGAGFGLYGYLPALLEGCGAEVALPSRYRPVVTARADIERFRNRVTWLDADGDVMAWAEALVVSRRPIDQEAAVDTLLGYANIRRVLLEKPLARTPRQAETVLRRLAESGRHIRIGYNFRHTVWAPALQRAASGGTIRIGWSFRAHHYAAGLRNWKRLVSCGGGALRFYGMHLIALLAELGYGEVHSSALATGGADEAETWDAVLGGKNLPDCSISVETDCDHTGFTVDLPGSPTPIITLRDPFDAAARPDGLDRRVNVLTDLCHDFLHGETISYPWYIDTLRLWSAIENSTVMRPAMAAPCGRDRPSPAAASSSPAPPPPPVP